MTLRELERDSIRAFVQSAADDGYLSGRVLDYGCGKQPYRDIVKAAGGEYLPFDRVAFPASCAEQDWGDDDAEIGTLDAILCTQVIQYIEDPFALLRRMPSLFGGLKHVDLGGGCLVLTYPTNWPEVEPEDLHRFTKAGMERLLTDAGFAIIRHEPRAFARLCDESVPKNLLSSEWLALGYGVIARA